MSRSVFTPGEAPFTCYEALDLPIFSDPGDGLGGLGFLEGDLRQTIGKALRGDVKSLRYCLRLLSEHELRKLSNGEWTKAAPQVPSCVAIPPSIADVLVMLGIACERDEPRRPGDTTVRVMIKDWVIERAYKQKGLCERYDDAIDDWHKRGAPDYQRFPSLVFDF